jgi:hypothetical protein
MRRRRNPRRPGSPRLQILPAAVIAAAPLSSPPDRAPPLSLYTTLLQQQASKSLASVSDLGEACPRPSSPHTPLSLQSLLSLAPDRRNPSDPRSQSLLSSARIARPRLHTHPHNPLQALCGPLQAPRVPPARAPAPPPPGRDPRPRLTPTRAVARPLTCVQAGAMWITFQTRSRRDTRRPSMVGRPLPWKARSATMVYASHSILSGHGMHRAPFLPCPCPRPLRCDHPCPTALDIHAHLPSASTNEPVTLPLFSSHPWRPSVFPIPQP